MRIFMIQGWRNLRRNKRRTSITVAVVAISLAILIFSYGLLEGFNVQMIEGGARTLNGHILIQAEGYQQKKNINLIIKKPTKIISLLNKDKRIQAWSSRLIARGLISSAEGVRGVKVLGVIPKKDKEVINLYKNLSKKSRLPQPQDTNKRASRRMVDVLIGQKIAHKLKIEIGSKAVLKIGLLHGGMTDVLMRVCGIFKTGSPSFDGFYIVVHQKDAQQFLKARGGVHQFAISLKDVNNVASVTAMLNNSLKALDKKSISKTNQLEILPWWESAPEIKAMVDMSTYAIGFSLLFIFPIVLLGCLNTMSMSVFERTREIGIMKALGTKPSQLIYLFFMEALFIGIVGVIIGIIIGGGANYFFEHNGGLSFRMLMSEDVKMMVSGVALEPVVWIRNSASVILIPAITVLLSTIIAGIFPAWKASRLQPSKAIFFY